MIDPKDLVAEALGCDKSTLGALSGLNVHPKWDSLAHVKIILSLEDNYGIEITDEAISKFTTLKAIEDFYLLHRNGEKNG